MIRWVPLLVLLAACGSATSPALTAGEAAVSAGGEVFSEHCAACHGDGARGTDQGPPLVDELYRYSHHADAAISLAISLGVTQHHWRFGPMEPVEGLSDTDVSNVIAYIRHVQAEAGIE